MGCGSISPLSKSNNKPANTKATTNRTDGKLPPIHSNQKSIKKKEVRERNIEPLTLVCLDEHFDENDKQLRSIIDYVSCFNNLDQCEEFIMNLSPNNFVFFIVSSEDFTNIISHIHESTQILAIYVFQDNKSKNSKKENIEKHWTKRYSKMKGVYFDRDILLEQLSSDVKMLTSVSDLIPITIYSRIDAIQTNNNSTDHLRFLFYQLFIHQYCLHSSSTSDKNDLLELVNHYYASNRHELKVIHEFEDGYTSAKSPLSWFLRDCFIQRILKKSLLTLDIPTLFSMRFFINDMHKAMVEKAGTFNSKTSFYQNGSGRFVSGRSGNEQVFYRGQALSKETFFKIKSNAGEILSMNDFMFASKNRQNSLGYLRQNIPVTNDVYRALFEIKIPSEYSLQKQRPFIDLSHSKEHHQSSNDEEKNISSILFFIGSIFRINTAVFDINNDCWVIQLTLYDEEVNEDFSQVFTFLNDMKRSNTENIVTLATLLRQISPNSAEQFYEYLLKENSQSLSKLECYRGLGLCSYSQDDYDQALTYFEKALHLKPHDKLTKSSLHNNMGLVYARQNQTDQALNHFNKALENSSSPLHIACVHHNLALIYSKQGQYENELNHYEEALRIRTNQFPVHHLQISSLHNNIGIAYSDMHEYDRALSNLRKALEIRLKLLSDNHIDVARTYANIGTVYAKTQEFRMALEYFDKAHLLFQKQQQLAQTDIEQLDRNIKIVNDKLRRKTC